jgi:hypothetical protein
MADFRFQIVGDASQAGQAISRVTSGLDDVKRRADNASRGFDNIQDKLSGLGVAANFMAGAAALGGLRSLAEGVQNLILEAEALEDRYTKVANHAQKFTTATKDVNLVINEQIKLARDLRTDLTSAMNLYDSVGDAVDELGLSQRQLLDLTRTLGEGATLAGKSFDQAGNIISRFAIATAAGSDGAREMKTLLRDFPQLGNALAEAWETDKAGVISMVASGKKNIQDLADVWIYQSGRIHDQAQSRKRTHEEIRAAVMEEANVMMNRGVPANLAYDEGFKKLSATMAKNPPLGREVAAVMLEISSTISDQAQEWKRLEDRMIEASRNMEHWISVAKQMPDLEKGIADGLKLASQAAEQMDKERAAAAEKHNRLLKEQLELARAIGLVSLPTPKITQREQLELYRKDLERMVSEEIEAEELAVQAAMDAVDAKIAAERDWVNAVTRAADEAAAKRLEQVAKDIEAAGQMREAWSRGLGSIAAEFANMAAEGEISVSKLGSALAKLALQMAAMRIGGGRGAFLGSFASGLQGFAHGGQFMVGGSGGTDSQLVAFRASPNERVTVETPQQQRQGTASSGPSSIIVNMQNDRRDVVHGMDSRDGQVALLKLDRRLRRQRRR